MQIPELKEDVQTWLTLAELCFGFGYHITRARFFAIGEMIDSRLDHWYADEQYKSPVKSLYRITEMIRQKATKNEAQIYIHLFIDLCRSLIKQIETPAEKQSIHFGDKVPYWREATVEAASQRNFARIDLDEPSTRDDDHYKDESWTN